MDISDLLIYLDENLTKNLNSLIINGYIEKRTSKWVEDRTLEANVRFYDKDLYYAEERYMKDERDGYKGKSSNKADTSTKGCETTKDLDGKRFLRREEELTRIYTTFELHQQLINSMDTSSLLKRIPGDWRSAGNINVGDYIEITGTISSESVVSYLDVFSDMVNCMGVSNIKNYCTCDSFIKDNFEMILSQMTHLSNLLSTNNTQDMIIKTDSNDVVVIVNNDNFFSSYANMFDEVECPCKVIGKVIKVCSSNEYIHLLRKSGHPNYYGKLLTCCCDICNNLTSSGLFVPTAPKLQVDGETILIIPISVSI